MQARQGVSQVRRGETSGVTQKSGVELAATLFLLGADREHLLCSLFTAQDVV